MPEPVATVLSAVPNTGAAAAGARLFTATLRRRDGEGAVEVFHACRAGDRREVVARLACRLGLVLATAATVRAGIDPHDPIVLSLLSADTVSSLREHGDLAGHALAGGGDLHILQSRG